jgi:hypothetical protein
LAALATETFTRAASSVLPVARVLGALSLLAVGAIHLQQYFELYSEIATIGTLFVLNFLGATVVGLGLLAPVERLLGRRGGAILALLALAGIGQAATAFVFLLISERTPLFGFQEPGYDRRRSWPPALPRAPPSCCWARSWRPGSQDERGRGGSRMMSEPLSDEALLAGLASGEADTAAAFVRRFQARVYGAVITIVRDTARPRMWRRRRACGPGGTPARTIRVAGASPPGC